jgi:class 3 adenylate cyclase
VIDRGLAHSRLVRSHLSCLPSAPETYLGRDPGRRVLAGGIMRGVADRIESVLWFSDLSGYTRISDTSPPEQVIPLLNDYADAIISAIHAHGGDVLKLSEADFTASANSGTSRSRSATSPSPKPSARSVAQDE